MKPFLIRMVLCLMITALAGLWGCAEKAVEPVQETPVVPEKPEEPEDKPSVVEMLRTEADTLIEQDNLQDALFVYNQALNEAGDQERDVVISDIERLLAKAEPALIAEFLEIKNLAIPEPLLLYWLGLNQTLAKAYGEALTALTWFIEAYPAHPYAAEARELISLIKQATFKKDAIGCLLPLSGKYAVFGQKALQGIQLAIRDLSEKYDRNFRIVVKDTASDAAKAVDCVDELAKEQVMGIVGPLLAVESAGQKAQELGIPMIALTQKGEFPLSGDYLFSNFITPEMQVQALGSYIFMELGLKRVAILYPDERYGRRYMELFWNVVDEFNGEVVGVESYDGSKTDFTDQIQKLTGEYYPVPAFLRPKPPEPEADGTAGTGESEPGESPAAAAPPEPEDDDVRIDFQALFIPDSPSRVNLILPQLAYNDARGMVLLGTNLWHHKKLISQTKGYNRNAVITDGYFGQSQNPATARFEAEFTALYGSSPGFLEAVSYDTAAILFEAGMDASVDSRETLRDALMGSRLFEGATGSTIFDKTGSPHKELFLITVKRNKFVEISQ